MRFFLWILFYFIAMTVEDDPVLPYNQPKLCPNATWESTATTLHRLSGSSVASYDIFVTTNNTIYIPNNVQHKVMVWLDGSSSSAINLSANWYDLYHVVITAANDLYVGVGQTAYTVYQWHHDTNNITIIMKTCSRCYDLFVDINNDLYCARADMHQVIRKSFHSDLETYTIIAGTGIKGSSSNRLDHPMGIFVDTNFDLYVADCGNNRIQLFKFGQTNGTTVPQNRSGSGSDLDCPTGIILDADKNLFVVDNRNNRIVRSTSNGFECIAGCCGGGVSGGCSNNFQNSLNNPRKIAFDSHGNIFVADTDNYRIQKFHLRTNTCNQTGTMQTLTSTTQTSPIVLETSTSITPSYNVSYNQPKLSLTASWYPNASTFAQQNEVGRNPYDVFITRDNTVYAPQRANKKVSVWLNGNVSSLKSVQGDWDELFSVFVTTGNILYVSADQNPLYNVHRWIENTSNSVPIFTSCQNCFDIFVDVNNNLYCSMTYSHQVIRKSLNPGPNAYTIVAGTGDSGSASHEFDEPMGIFVDTNFDLYVADCNNNRIQRFEFGKSNGTTIANGSMSSGTGLYCPSAIILDSDKNLYISDLKNNRIVRWGSNGSQCIVGCSGSGPASNQLNYPRGIAFDSHGNIFVTDCDNHRIQVFHLSTNSFDESSTTTTTTTTSTSSSTESSSSYRFISSSVISTSFTSEFRNTSHIGTAPSAMTFVVLNCPNPHRIGINCSISNDPCDIIKPCQNNGTCTMSSLNSYGYECRCSPEINGTDCENDHRICRPNTCATNGECRVDLQKNSFECFCRSGWTGTHCETQINFCSNVTCLNNGVCRSTFLNYSCECVSSSYSGRHCEISSKTLVTRQIICKSFGYVALICLIVVILFIVFLDALKYVFGIDSIENDSLKSRREKWLKRKRQNLRRHRRFDSSAVAIRFIYVNDPSTGQ